MHIYSLATISMGMSRMSESVEFERKEWSSKESLVISYKVPICPQHNSRYDEIFI